MVGAPCIPQLPLALKQLARLYGVLTSYTDAGGVRRFASAESLLAVLQALGAPLATVDAAAAACRARRLEQWRQLLEPVAVAWQDRPCTLRLRLPRELAEGKLWFHLALESGEQRRWNVEAAALPVVQSIDLEGERYIARELRLLRRLPLGYHRLRVEHGKQHAELRVISAPWEAYPSGSVPRLWGVFAPLYALRSRQSLGCGGFGELAQLAEWISHLGGGVVATLPFFATFLDQPFAPGPYAPASRLFWNELYLDPRRTLEFEQCPSAQQVLAQLEEQQTLEELRRSPLVDYRRQAAAQRQVLAQLAACFFAHETPASYRSFLAEHPAAEDYARFRAAGEAQGAGWPAWPAPLCEGLLRPGDYDEAVQRVHLYAQWRAHEQIQQLAGRARQHGPGLYVDMPLGVHSASYDTWRYRDQFALEIDVGAPPDLVFTKGQNWAFAPLHPEHLRAARYGYLDECLQHITSQAGVLRLDHVMSLHRLFWIPRGAAAQDGVYVRYPADELYALLCVASHRQRCWLVGENLGTVPPAVNEAMRRHNFHQMYVLQYELEGQRPGGELPAVPPASLACLNTHDMPPFAGFWRGLDLEDRRELGLFAGPNEFTRTCEERSARRNALVAFLQGKGLLQDPFNERAVLEACLAYLGAGPSRLVLVNLEDLWLEAQPQNTPGTRSEQRPNWRRKLAHPLEQIEELRDVRELLEHLARLRREPCEPASTARE